MANDISRNETLGVPSVLEKEPAPPYGGFLGGEVLERLALKTMPSMGREAQREQEAWSVLGAFLDRDIYFG